MFLSEKQYAVSKVTTSVQIAVFQPWHRPAIILPLVYCPVDNTLFEVSTEIRCSGVSSRYCCYGNNATTLKIFHCINWELNKVSHYQLNIISKYCELVKLCHINSRGTVFLRQCIIKLSYTVDELLRGDSRGYFFGASSIIYVVLMAT